MKPSALAAFCIALLVVATTTGRSQSFLEEQLKYPKVVVAKSEKDSVLRSLFAARHLIYPPANLFVRVFKKEMKLEVWASDQRSGPMTLVKEYTVCASSGVLGPKRREGDLQVPEGFYSINIFNPLSTYYLSLGVSYPNASDRVLSDKKHPGGDIMIHGNCVTIGCVPITDDCIKEVYWLAVQAHAAGQQEIPVHMFPGMMDGGGYARLLAVAAGDSALLQFWANLKPGYDAFEHTKLVPSVSVDSDGKYKIR
jgi:murein L,D-transpeptidase YafK